MKRLLVVMLCAAALARLEAQDPERLLRAATNLEMVDGNLKDAIAQYRKVAAVPRVRQWFCHEVPW